MKGLELPAWDQVFVPDLSLAESFVRGTLVYFGILLLFRVVLKRQAGGVGLPDIMLAVLVSECVSSSINANANSVPNGLAAVGAMLFWSYALDWATHRWPRLRRRLESGPVVLIRDGRPVKENMDRERVTEDELCEQLRLNGVDDPAKVKEARIESGGEVSVIEKDEGAKDGPRFAANPGRERGGNEQGADDHRPPEPPDFDRAVGRFLAAAEELRAAVDWHAARAAEHRKKADAARQALARHGVRGRKWLATAADPPSAVRHDPHPEPTR
ncbi:MAG: DUF421 domain-containing protein [Gemmataceae bacterium]|nr:DUF421 domain-containing protein [Gemmataceae bacterium]